MSVCSSLLTGLDTVSFSLQRLLLVPEDQRADVMKAEAQAEVRKAEAEAEARKVEAQAAIEKEKTKKAQLGTKTPQKSQSVSAMGMLHAVLLHMLYAR